MCKKSLFIKNVILSITMLLLIFSCSKKDTQKINSFREIEKYFSNPPVEFRSVPLWVWNDDVTEEIIDKQLTDLHSKGIGGVFVHPRSGFITPYFSERYFSLYEHTYNKLKELGMIMWLYDENGYPSGFAGGLVKDEMPNAGGKKIAVNNYEVLPKELKGEILKVFKIDGLNYSDITDKLKGEDSQTGDYYVFELVDNPSQEFLDLLTK